MFSQNIKTFIFDLVIIQVHKLQNRPINLCKNVTAFVVEIKAV